MTEGSSKAKQSSKARPRKACGPMPIPADQIVNFRFFMNGKSSRKATSDLKSVGCATSHTRLALMRNGGRLRNTEALEAAFHRLGGMLPPGAPSDRDRRNDALAFAGFTTPGLNEERTARLLDDAFHIWPAVLRGDSLPPGRRLTLGVAMLLTRDAAINKKDVRDEISPAILEAVGYR